MTTAFGEICWDILKESIKSLDECREAAREVGNTFIRRADLNLNYIPKGCIRYGRGNNVEGVVLWNPFGRGGFGTHLDYFPMGIRDDRSEEICRSGGKFTFASMYN